MQALKIKALRRVHPLARTALYTRSPNTAGTTKKMRMSARIRRGRTRHAEPAARAIARRPLASILSEDGTRTRTWPTDPRRVAQSRAAQKGGAPPQEWGTLQREDGGLLLLLQQQLLLHTDGGALPMEPRHTKMENPCRHYAPAAPMRAVALVSEATKSAQAAVMSLSVICSAMQLSAMSQLPGNSAIFVAYIASAKILWIFWVVRLLP